MGPGVDIRADTSRTGRLSTLRDLAFVAAAFIALASSSARAQAGFTLNPGATTILTVGASVSLVIDVVLVSRLAVTGTGARGLALANIITSGANGFVGLLFGFAAVASTPQFSVGTWVPVGAALAFAAMSIALSIVGFIQTPAGESTPSRPLPSSNALVWGGARGFPPGMSG